MKRYFIFLLTVFLFGCGLYPSVPIEKMEFRAGDKLAKQLVVLLSGRGATASYFKDNNWVELARYNGIQVDFVAPHAHFGYYMTNALLPRLHQDVILPARQMGYESISLVGISMGGLGSILYSERFPEEIDSIYLFAPYLGDKKVHDEIRAAGGLANWQIKPENSQDWNHYIWRRLKEITDDEELNNKIFLGYGDEDKMQGLDLLEARLPREHVIKVSGGHKDVVFTRLWELMLEKGFLDFQAKVVSR